MKRLIISITLGLLGALAVTLPILAGTLPPGVYIADERLNQLVYGTEPVESAQQNEPLRGGFIEGGDMIPPDPDTGLADLQAAYYITYSHYWQGLQTHSSIPDVTNPITPDRAALHPTDLGVSWLDLGALATTQTLEIALTVDVYDGPSGSGYTVLAQTIVSDMLWMRTINTGPEAWRQHGWISVTQEITPVEMIESIPLLPMIIDTPEPFRSVIATPQPAATRPPIEGLQ